jgi:hypothetical protein
MSRKNSREIRSYTGGNGNSSSNFAYGNTAGIYRFDANPIPSTNDSGNYNNGGGSSRITITNINGNGRLNVSGSRLSMTSMKSSLPNKSQSQSQSRQRTTGGAQLHPNDYKMVQYFNSLPTKFTMGGGRKSHTR